MRRSLAKFSESEASNHTPSLADFITTTSELRFSVHTASPIKARSNPLGKSSYRLGWEQIRATSDRVCGQVAHAADL